MFYREEMAFPQRVLTSPAPTHLSVYGITVLREGSWTVSPLRSSGISSAEEIKCDIFLFFKISVTRETRSGLQCQ